jgi:hypothetical protein
LTKLDGEMILLRTPFLAGSKLPVMKYLLPFLLLSVVLPRGAHAQDGVVLDAGFDPVMGPVITWNGKAGTQYEVLRSTTNLLRAAFTLAPFGVNSLEDNSPAAFGNERMFYRDPEVFLPRTRRYYLVREVDAGKITLFLLARKGVVTTDAGEQPPFNWHLQLIWSSDALASPLNHQFPFIPTEGEVILLEQPMNDLNGDVDLFLLEGNNNHSGVYAGGYLYLRIFNVDIGSGSIPTLYGQSMEIFGPLQLSAINPGSVNQINPAAFSITNPIQP